MKMTKYTQEYRKYWKYNAMPKPISSQIEKDQMWSKHVFVIVVSEIYLEFAPRIVNKYFVLLFASKWDKKVVDL